MTPNLTLNDPALVGVAGTAEAPCNFDYDYTCGNDSAGIGKAYDQYAIKNEKGVDTTVKTATWYFITKGGVTPSGNAQAHIYESDGTTKVASSDLFNVDVVTATGVGQPCVFTFTPAVTWEDDYYLAVEFGTQDMIGIPNSYTSIGGCTTPTNMSAYYWKNATSSWIYWFDVVPLFPNCVTSCS